MNISNSPDLLKNKRNSTIDSLKGVLIILVVLGHWLEYGFAHETNRIVFNYIYLFHMPLFILISGYFSKRTDFGTFIKKMQSLVEVYIVVQILYVGSSILLQGKSYNYSILYTPNAAAWYLLSLISWRTLLQFVPDKWLHRKSLLYLSIIVSIISGFIPLNDNEFSILRTLTFLPFFMFGFFLKNNNWKINKYSSNLFKYSVLLIPLGIMFLIGNKDLSLVLYGKYPYYNSYYSPQLMMSLRLVFLIVAFIMSINILSLHTYIHTYALAFIGKNSLIFYIYHIIFLRLFVLILRKIGFPTEFPFMIMYCLLTLCILYILSRMSIFKKILNPINLMVK